MTVNTVAFVSSTVLFVDVSIDAAAAVDSARDVTVRNSPTSSATCSSCFTVNAKPAITAVSPNARSVGASHQIVTIAGSHFASGATASFGAGITVNSVQVTDATHLKVDLSVAANAAIGIGR